VLKSGQSLLLAQGEGSSGHATHRLDTAARKALVTETDAAPKNACGNAPAPRAAGENSDVKEQLGTPVQSTRVPSLDWPPRSGDARPMRNMMLLAMAGVAAFSVLGGGCAGGKEAILKPSMVSKDFKDLDDENPFEKKATSVHFLKVGIKKYDAFFQDAAEVKGTVVIADVVLKETDVFIASIKKDLSKGKVLTPVQQKRMKREQERLESLTKLLGDIPDRSTKLLDSSEALADTAPKTFLGPDAVKLPGVVKGIQQSAEALKQAASKSPALFKHATKTTTELAEFT
jgi:hypothetical protein